MVPKGSRRTGFPNMTVPRWSPKGPDLQCPPIPCNYSGPRRFPTVPKGSRRTGSSKFRVPQRSPKGPELQCAGFPVIIPAPDGRVPPELLVARSPVLAFPRAEGKRSLLSRTYIGFHATYGGSRGFEVRYSGSYVLSPHTNFYLLV